MSGSLQSTHVIVFSNSTPCFVFLFGETCQVSTIVYYNLHLKKESCLVITPQFYGVARPGHLRPRGEHNKKEHGGERIYLGYREHSLTVCLLASQARNRWIVTMTKKRRYCQRGVAQTKAVGTAIPQFRDHIRRARK